MKKQKENTEKPKKGEVTSRLGRKPIPIPEGVKVSVQGQDVTVEGKRGKLIWSLPSIISGKVEEKQVVVEPKKIESASKPFHGLSRKLVANMIEGVVKGFEKKLVIEGVGFRAQVSGDKLNMTLGFSHPVVYLIPKGISIKVEGKGQNHLLIEGNDKQTVGQVAADIRSIKPPEPYKGTGIRYEAEMVKRKAGKAAVGAAGGGKK